VVANRIFDRGKVISEFWRYYDEHFDAGDWRVVQTGSILLGILNHIAKLLRRWSRQQGALAQGLLRLVHGGDVHRGTKNGGAILDNRDPLAVRWQSPVKSLELIV